MERLDLTGPNARVHRAREHLESLKSQSATFIGSQPFIIVPEFEPLTRDHVLRIWIRGFIPVHLSLVVGDVIHNARSALDQTAWMLATRDTEIDELWSERTARRIAFPVIRTNEKDFFEHKSMRYFSNDTKEILADLQPYRGGHLGRSIDRLDRYWNIDKHRTLHPGFAKLELSRVSVRPKFLIIDSDFPGEPEWSWTNLEGPIEDGTEIGRVRFAGGGGPPEVQLDVVGQPAADLAFGNSAAGVEISNEDLESILVDVETIIAKFADLSAESVQLLRRRGTYPILGPGYEPRADG